MSDRTARALGAIGIWAALAAAAMGALAAGPSSAQDTPFRPIAVVNTTAITGYDIAQRAQILAALGFPTASAEALRNAALDQLVQDALKLQAGAKVGLRPTPALIEAGIEEYAASARLSVGELRALMANQGVSDQALDDLIAAEVIWREVVRGRFAGRIEPAESEIDAEIQLAQQRSATAFRVQEIGLPVGEGGRDEAATRALAEELVAEFRAGGDFDAAVRRHSRAPSAARGGQVGWLPTEQLPSALLVELAALEPGQVTRPIPVSGGFSILKLLEKRTEGAALDAADPDLRARVRSRIVNQEGARLAEGLLQELRRDALIELR